MAFYKIRTGDIKMLKRGGPGRRIGYHPFYTRILPDPNHKEYDKQAEKYLRTLEKRRKGDLGKLDREQLINRLMELEAKTAKVIEIIKEKPDEKLRVQRNRDVKSKGRKKGRKTNAK